MKDEAVKNCAYGMVVFIIFMVFMTVFAFGMAQAADQTVKLPLGNAVQQNHSMTVAAEKFPKKVAEKTNIRAKITVFPSRRLLSNAEAFPGMSGFGIADNPEEHLMILVNDQIVDARHVVQTGDTVKIVLQMGGG